MRISHPRPEDIVKERGRALCFIFKLEYR